MISDSTKFNSSETPSCYVSVTGPKFKGRVILTYPSDDDAVA